MSAPTDATVWVETDGPCEVRDPRIPRAHLARRRAPLRAGRIAGLPSRAPSTPYEVRLDGDWSGRCPSDDRPPQPDPHRVDRVTAGADRVRLLPVRRRRGGAARPPVRRRRAGRLRAEDRRPARGPMAARAGHARRPGVRRRDVAADAGADPAAPRHHARARRSRSPTSRSTPGSTRVLDRPRGALAAVHRADVDDLRRPRRARRLEHLAVLARRTCRPAAGGRSGSSARCRRTGCTSTWAICRPPSWPTTSCTSRSARLDGDAEPLLREFADGRRREADGAKGARWSYRRDFGPVRLLVIDSRCGRILDQGRRSMLSEAEFDWIERPAHRRLRAPADRHLAALAAAARVPRHRGLERAAVRRPPRSRWSPGRPRRLRRAADFEHWAAFRESFERLAALIGDVGRGEYTADPRRARRRPPSACCPATSTTPTSPGPEYSRRLPPPSTS